MRGDEAELVHLAASTQQGSEHPLAGALLELASERGIALSPVADFQSYTGRGIAGTIEGRQILIGNERLLEENGLDPTAELKRARDWEEKKAKAAAEAAEAVEAGSGEEGEGDAPQGEGSEAREPRRDR